MKQVKAFAGFIAWVASTFRLPKSEGLSCSPVYVDCIPSTSHTRGYGWVSDPDRRLFSIHIGKLQIPQSSESFCWKPLFEGSVVAYGFPVPQKPPGMRGLQIPFPVMLKNSLMIYDSSVENDDGVKAGIYLAGVSSILFPVSMSADRKTVQWHLEPKPMQSETRIHLLKDSMAWAREQNTQSLAAANAVLGYCNDVKIQLGTKSRLSQYYVMACSRAAPEDPAVEASVTTATVGFSIAGATFNVATTWKQGSSQLVKTERSESMAWSTLLDSMSNTPVLVMDVERQCAWMVPQICLILDLFNYWLSDQSLDIKYRLLDTSYAGEGYSGASAAKEILSKIAGTMVLEKGHERDKEKEVADMIRDIWGQVEKRMDTQDGSGPNLTIKFRRKGPIPGWDLIELVPGMEETVANRRQVQHIDGKPCWLPLCRIVPLFFGRKLGELMTPAQRDTCCKSWSPLPGGDNTSLYLAASVQCLKSLTKRYGEGAAF